MTEGEILQALDVGEDRDWEFKLATGGLPRDLWETYSAMANSDGGTIVLGVREIDGTFEIVGLSDVQALKKAFWDTIHNQSKVNLNVLNEPDVEEKRLNGRSLLIIHVPRATRKQRPLYIGPNPQTGTFRRDFQGDYRCTQGEVSRMFADQSDEPADSRILEHFSLRDLDEESVKQYRQRFDARDPNHPWLSLQLPQFLEKVGAWRKERSTGKEGLTVAGLLMFGLAETIQDSEAVPQYHIDYRERLSPDPAVRWTDRLTIDGTWAGNLFQFYQRMLKKLSADLKIPFKLDQDLFRKDETIVHEAIREAVVNALVHADYRGQCGIVIEKFPDRIELSNPGILLISWEQVLQGGFSECRNKTLQKMFHLIGGGEKAGSGIDKIRQGWASQHWRFPSIQERMRPDRVRLFLPMMSLIPDESLKRLRLLYGDRFHSLSKPEVEALVTADLEGEVSNERLREIHPQHPTELTKILQRLAANGFLTPYGKRRWTTYKLTEKSEGTPNITGGTPIIAGRTPIITEGTPIITEGTPIITKNVPPTHSSKLSVSNVCPRPANWDELMGCSAVVRQKDRVKPAIMRQIILELCQNQFLTSAQLGELFNRQTAGLRQRYLQPMTKEGLLILKYPNNPTRPDQAYKATSRRS